MSDLTIVIPHRGNALGLWSTIHSCDEDLYYTDFKYNYVIVTNGEPVSTGANQTLRRVKDMGRLLEHIHSPEPLTPPVARQRGASMADGKLLFFFDNHCLVTRRYFERAVLDMEVKKMDMLHSATIFYTGEYTHYHYRLTLDYNFWGRSAFLIPDTQRPYRIAAGGHGGFVVRKDVWDEVGGYGPEELFTGYGGEEILFDLKMARLGKTNWLDPKLIHYHYTGLRGYERHYTDEYYTNMLVAAFVIGGERWLYKVYESFITNSHARRTKTNMFDLLEEAYNRGARYAQELDSKSLMTLDTLLVWFKQNQIAM